MSFLSRSLVTLHMIVYAQSPIDLISMMSSASWSERRQGLYGLQQLMKCNGVLKYVHLFLCHSSSIVVIVLCSLQYDVIYKISNHKYDHIALQLPSCWPLF